MKLLLIHNFYRSNNIGGEDLVFRDELFSLQSKLGKENVFSYHASNDELSIFGTILSIWFSWKHFFRVYRLLKIHQIDLVHVHNFFPMLTPSVFLAAKLGGAKVVNTLHNYRFWCISGPMYRENVGICELCANKTFPLSGILYRCYRNSRLQSVLAQSAYSFYRVFRLFLAIDFYFVLTEFQRAKVASLGIDARKIYLKPNGIPRQDHKISSREDFLYVGRMENSKGIDILLETWLTLNPSLRLTLIGGGARLDEIREKYNRPNIVFLGNLPHKQVLEKMASAKFLLQTSLLYETFGMTVLEAFSVGTPVIGFAIGTRSEFVKDQENGFLGDPSELAETILRANEFANYESLSRSATDTARKYKLSLIVEKQVSIYRDILN